MPADRPPHRSTSRRRPAPRRDGTVRAGNRGRKPDPVLKSYRRVRRRRSPLAWFALAVLAIAALVYATPRVAERLGRPQPNKPAAEKPAAETTRSPGKDTEVAETEPTEPESVRAAREAIKVESFLGGQRRDLTGFGPAPKALNLKWKLKLGSGPTQRKSDNALVSWAGSGWTGQPTVVEDGGRTWLLLGAYDHNLHRIDAKNGKVKWEAKWPDVMKGTNTIVPNPSAADEKMRMIVVSGSRRGSDLRVGDKRIAPLRAVSFSTGKELWRLPVPKTHNYSQDVDSSPLWYQGVLYAPVESGYVYALDPFTIEKRDGINQPKVIARSPRLYDASDVRAHPDIGESNLAIEASPSAIEDVIYITSGAGHVYGLDRRTLKVVWDFKTGTDIDGTPSVTKDGKLLVTLEKQYTKKKGGAYLLDPSKPVKDAVVWYYPTPTSGFAEWEGGAVCSVTTNEASNDGSKPRLAALNTIDGKVRIVSIDKTTGPKAKGPGAKNSAPQPVEVFTDSIGSSISSPIIVGDRMVTAGYNNKVYLYRLRFEKTSKDSKGALPSPDGRWWKVTAKRTDSFAGRAAFESTPLVYGGRVYIGCRDGYLYCLGD